MRWHASSSLDCPTFQAGSRTFSISAQLFELLPAPGASSSGVVTPHQRQPTPHVHLATQVTQPFIFACIDINSALLTLPIFALLEGKGKRERRGFCTASGPHPMPCSRLQPDPQLPPSCSTWHSRERRIFCGGGLRPLDTRGKGCSWALDRTPLPHHPTCSLRQPLGPILANGRYPRC